MGLLSTIREALGIAPTKPRETPRRRPPTVTYSAELVSTPPVGYESVYLPRELQAELLVPRADGLPPLHLVRHAGAVWLAEDTTGKLVNAKCSYLRRLGIWGVSVRGTDHYDAKAVLGPAQLVREPDNAHDPNAVAIHVRGHIIGHFNKRKAAGLARAIDAGEPVAAEVISISPAKVIAARPEILQHLHRRV